MVYRDYTSQCVRCKRALNPFDAVGYRYEMCHECESVFVDLKTLISMWDDMSNGKPMPHFDARSDGAGPRGCPKCGEPMRRVELLVVPLDHCPVHGVWFDREELATTLAGAAMPPDEWFRYFMEKLARMS
jgi:Zn-finger nucleic acid-binding protein